MKTYIHQLAYRGYHLTVLSDGQVMIYFYDEMIGVKPSEKAARHWIDERVRK